MTSPTQDIPKKIQELQNAQSQIRFWRTLTIVAVILIVITCLGLISTSVAQLANEGPRQDEFLNELIAGVNEDVLPELQRIGAEAAADVAPLVQQELENLDDVSREVALAIHKEMERLTMNVRGESEMVLDRNFRTMIEKRRFWLEDNFGDVRSEDVETTLKNITDVAHERIESFSDEAFAGQIIALNRITENLETIRKSELPDDTKAVPNWEMALMFFDLLREEIRKIESSNIDTAMLDEADLENIEESAN